MEMAELVEMIQDRQGKTSIESYANQIGIRGATLYRYYNKQRDMSLEVIRKLIQFYRQQGDTEMVDALKEFAVGDGDSSPPQ